jgi:hypothetical protein
MFVVVGHEYLICSWEPDAYRSRAGRKTSNLTAIAKRAEVFAVAIRYGFPGLTHRLR